MEPSTRLCNPVARVIRALLPHEYELSIHSKHVAHALPAKIAELDVGSGRLVLEAEYSGPGIERYLADGCLSLDIEASKLAEPGEREAYSLDSVATTILKTDVARFRLDCTLPETVIVKENRDGVRIPFILGMVARVSIEAYPSEATIPGRLRNLSTGGCMVDIDIAESAAITVGQLVPGVTLEFPSGETFFAEGCIRHMRPFGNHGHAAVGIQFVNLTATQSRALFHYTSEAEREVAYRSGASDKVNAPSALFVNGSRTKKILRRNEQERRRRARQSPMQRAVLEIARQLQVGLMYVKSRDRFPEEIFYDCADTLLYLIAKDRKEVLYALAFLRHQPDWVRHAIQVAGQLADVMLTRDPYLPQAREAILGTLLHTLGKPLLISTELPSLNGHMAPRHKEILKAHVGCLQHKMQALGWQPSTVCRDVIENANETLDGAGYPAGNQAAQLSDLVKQVSVIKIINKLTNPRNGLTSRSPLAAYRRVNEAPQAYDKDILVAYIQHYGLYPIGSLVRFSCGFLAWIMDINAKGTPVTVRVVKNLAFRDVNLDTVLGVEDFHQIGKLECVVDPAEFGL